MGKQFVLELEGLEELRERLDGGRVNKQLAQGMGRAVNNLHIALERETFSKYNISDSLDTIRVGKSNSLATSGRNILKANLEYKFKPRPLSKFFVAEKQISANSKFLIKGLRGGIRPLNKNYALVPYVKILRKGSAKPVTGKKGFGGFLVKPGRGHDGSKWSVGSIRPRRGIYERQQNATWKNQGGSKQTLSSLGKRAKIKPLFGPSLSQMAGTVFEESPVVELAIKNFSTKVIEFIDI